MTQLLQYNIQLLRNNSIKKPKLSLSQLYHISNKVGNITLKDLVDNPKLPCITYMTPLYLHWNDELPPFCGFIDKECKIYSWWSYSPKFIGDLPQMFLYRYSSADQWISTVRHLMDGDIKLDKYKDARNPGFWGIIKLGPERGAINLHELRQIHYMTTLNT